MKNCDFLLFNVILRCLMQGCFPFHCYFEVHNFKSIIDVNFLKKKKIMIIQRQFSIQNGLHVKKKILKILQTIETKDNLQGSSPCRLILNCTCIS